jgi:hypothetical protein
LLLVTKINPVLALGGLPEDSPDPALRSELERVLAETVTLNESSRTVAATVLAAEGVPTASVQAEIEQLRTEIKTKSETASALSAQADESQRQAQALDEKLGLRDLSRENASLKRELERLRAKTREILREMNELEAKVREVEAQTLAQQNKIWVIPGSSRTSKEPLLVVISGSSVTLERFDRPGSKLALTLQSGTRLAETKREFLTRLEPFDRLNHYLVFFIKPSGITVFDDLKEAAKRAGYEVGYDAVEEETEVVFGQGKLP